MSSWPLLWSLLIGASVVLEGLPCTPLEMAPELLWLLLATPPRPRLSLLWYSLPRLEALLPVEALTSGEATREAWLEELLLPAEVGWKLQLTWRSILVM